MVRVIPICKRREDAGIVGRCNGIVGPIRDLARIEPFGIGCVQAGNRQWQASTVRLTLAPIIPGSDAGDIPMQAT
jgi:hypothetical protein